MKVSKKKASIKTSAKFKDLKAKKSPKGGSGTGLKIKEAWIQI